KGALSEFHELASVRQAYIDSLAAAGVSETDSLVAALPVALDSVDVPVEVPVADGDSLLVPDEEDFSRGVGIPDKRASAAATAEFLASEKATADSVAAVAANAVVVLDAADVDVLPT